MKNLMKSCLLAFALVLMPTGVSLAQDTAAESVSAALAEGNDPLSIIASLMAAPLNMPVEKATLAGIEAGGESNQDAFAAAGIGAASNMVEAEAVATAVLAVGVDASVVKAAMQQYVRLMDQPYIHHDGADPAGGGGPRPPVSPAS